jgi:RimJ/RimL family protein N-acetyltransferase
MINKIGKNSIHNEENMEIRTKRLFIREMRPDDLDALIEMAAHPEAHTYEHHPLNVETELRNFLEGAIERARQQPRTHYRFALTIPPSERLCGRLALTLNWEEIREWEIGWHLHSLEWGKGYATEAAQALLEFAFQELKAHRVVAYCNAFNERSVRVMQRLGMQQDGRLRGTRWWNGGWVDEYVYAILEDDFLHAST